MIAISLQSRVCPLCGTRQFARRISEANVNLEDLDQFAFASRKLPEYMHWQLWECRDCDLLYSDPAPSPDHLAELYGAAQFDSRQEARHASRTYARFLAGIIPRLPDRHGAADIGTGDGAFLSELLTAGFENVVGIEPSTAPIEAADPMIRPLIRHDLFREDSFEPQSLSLITCFQTIEHLPDPLAFCKAAERALKPGGVLFLIGHNRRAFSAKVLGHKSPIYDIEHYQLFSPASIRNLLERSGFPNVTVSPVLNRYPLQYWARLFPLPAVLKRPVLKSLESASMGRWMIPLPAGNLAAIAQK